ncbi:MAG: Putative transport protein YhhT [Candidatus Moanabacter tarae]|uniref:Transport protein YhhT n=1 Tax=Candidatus Moanibacter tarae TaxID=2200854 RepID=A0A2Z4AAS9_9BACT|nr:MAG: Putative transport protein YhhT [Candidatus Moanabacter tarae]
MSNVINESRIQTTCLLILSAFCLGTALFFLRPVLIPFILAIFLTYSLTPIIDLQRNCFRMPRFLAVLTTILLGCLLLFLLSLIVSASASEMATHADEYQKRFQRLLDSAIVAIPFDRFGIQPQAFTSSIVRNLQDTVGGMLGSTASALINVLSKGILVLIFMIFMFLGRKDGIDPNAGIWGEVELRVRRYIINMILISAATGLIVGTSLTLIGVEFALVFGFSAFVLNFIPSIGSMIATLLPLPVVLLNPDLSVTLKTLAIVIPGLVQFGIGNLLTPKVMGDSLDLHPVAVLSALIFFGLIWGIVGMFLATPIAAITKILLEKVEITRPIANLLAGRIHATG